MIETWRWFGPQDNISLENVMQAGAQAIVTSLGHITTGDLWPLEDVLERKAMIEQAGLFWSVVESIPVHNDIKKGHGQHKLYIENYKQSIRNLGAAGVNIVCYNFMPVVDWTRTNLSYELDNKSQALRFDMIDFVMYDVFILEREGAEDDYPDTVVAAARDHISDLSDDEKHALEQNIIAGLPGGEGSYGRESIRAELADYKKLSEVGLRQNLIAFLKEVVPVAEEAGVRLCIHPDDPPFSLFGLPRVLSTADDVRIIFSEIPSMNNGLTLCSGSFGARGDNDLIAMVREFGPRIHFSHLRNVKREENMSFHEAEHLDGDNDMVGLVSAFLDEETARRKAGREDCQIPMRPDHGHAIRGEKESKNTNPGYTFAGRLKGLAELRGVLLTLKSLGK